MSQSILILLLSLSIAGLIWSAHGDVSAAMGPTELAPTSSTKPSPTSSGLAATSRNVLSLLKHLLRILERTIRAYLRPVLRGTKTLVTDMLTFIFSSDDTSVARTRRRKTSGGGFDGSSNDDDDDDDDDDNSSSGRNFVYRLATLFFAPFKKIYNFLNWVPYEAIYDNISDALRPLGELLNNPIIEAMANATILMSDRLTESAWNFTKISVLPKLDIWVTGLKESNTVPKNVMIYLSDLQTLYHILHSFNIA